MPVLALTCCSGLLAACEPSVDPEAAKFCLEHAGVIQKDGEHEGMCVFSDGSMCEPGAYMRSQCAPGVTINGD
jgi:putative hemolysin